MAQEYRAKVFKSGNSLAIRLPKALGAVEGTEMRVREENGTFTFEPAEVKQKLDISGFWGRAPWLVLAPREDFEERPSTIARREAAAKLEAAAKREQNPE